MPSNQVLTKLTNDLREKIAFADDLTKGYKGIYFNGRSNQFCGRESDIKLYSSNDQALTRLLNKLSDGFGFTDESSTGCEEINFSRRGYCRGASEIPSNKAYNDHPEARGPKFGPFKEVIFYGSSSDGSVMRIGDILRYCA